MAPGDEKRCNECINRILSHSDTICGVALSGLTDGNEDANEISVENLQAIFRKVGVSFMFIHWLKILGCYL